MAKVQCDDCGASWIDGIEFCPNCGSTDLTEVKKEEVPIDREQQPGPGNTVE